MKLQGGGSVTEFIIELPASEGNLPVSINEPELIHHSSELELFRKEEATREEYGDTANITEFMHIHKERKRPLHMLIVDDEPLFRKTIRSLLSSVPQARDHVKVAESGNAEEALALFKAREFDYVIADIDLGRGKMDGYDFTKMILDAYLNTYVLIHSNKRKDEMDKGIREIKSPHFMGFLPKPMKQSELLQFLACRTFEASAQAGKSSNQGKKSILFVNDDESMLFTMEFVLKTLSDKVFTAATVSEAREKLAKNEIDMIFSDVNFGEKELSGYDLLKHVREYDKNKPFYILSGYGKKEEEPKAIALGATGYMQLPISAEELKEVLQ